MKKVSLILVTIAALVCGSVALADSWALPTPQKYYSENKKYYVEVIPRLLESQLKYFEDKSAKREPAGGKPGVKDNYCRGVFYKQNDGGAYEKVWEGRLTNDVAPVAALVSDSGEYFVTFDNWHLIGYGDNIVAIYGPGGSLVRKMALTDIFPRESMIRLPRSVSSIYWGGEHRIDDKKRHLVLQVVSKWSGDFEDKPEYRELRVDLKTGELVKEERPAV